MGRILIETAGRHDVPDWAIMREELWPGTDSADHQIEVNQLLEAYSDTLNLIARNSNGDALGFAEAAIRRDYVNGCDTSPVGFLEGIYVRAEFRRQGIARQLLQHIAEWTRSQGCTELASDAPIGNIDSQLMHQGLGFEETQRVVYFRKLVG
ncbi:aminoglycoside 6'-N-acetyltransferase [uncultured Devosia sp.]|uniref:aminoglycoside 6'-N-acetyltransferase n=1 Tax=uncultured Devosia sp. TaxID=211434 RepID=UPI0035CC4EE9